MGPIVLFDKSFIEMLNVDEAAIFDALYSSVICPIFFTEVLADLSKQKHGERSVERIVADVARKSPIMHSTPNIMHTSICSMELAGSPVEMRRVPVLAGGRPVRRQDGKVGVVYDQSPEAKAFNRWQRGQFLEIEHEFAAKWRQQLARTEHAKIAKLAKQVLQIRAEPRSLADAMAIAKEVVYGEGQRFTTLKTAYALLGLKQSVFSMVQDRWVKAGRPHLTLFAPYTAYCLLVDIFFHVAIDKKLISPDRSSNRVDLAYLYYLPFCMMFVSNDKLHRRTAPLFLNEDQLFVGGAELKDDLAALDQHYSSLSDAEKSEGLFRLASYPPDGDSYLTSRVWKQLGLRLRPKDNSSEESRVEKPPATSLIEEVKRMQAASGQGSFTSEELKDPSHVVIERLVPLQRGKWRLMPLGVKGDA